MRMKKFASVAFIAISLIFAANTQSYGDDTDLFSVQIAPDALLLLDLSGSMAWTPAGGTMYISSTQWCQSDVAYYTTSGSGHTQACTIDSNGTIPKWSTTSCSGPFYTSARTVSGVDYKTDCSRLAIAKRAIFDLLDDTRDDQIKDDDQSSLGIRMGYMRFYNCSSDDTGGDYSKGCNSLIREINSHYSDIWSSVNSEKDAGGTPLASALNEAKLYLDYNKSKDDLKDCRKKFVILVTDGADTFACGGGGSSDQTDQYKRRRETVAKAKALSDAGYNVYVVGFGADMPHYLKNTLNWAAYYAQTDNFSDPNSGDPKGYSIPSGKLYPSGITSCQSSSTSSHNLGDGSHYYATSNDPGEKSLSGYAFLASDASELTTALKSIARYIQERSYSFTYPTVPSVQLTMADTMYLSSFIPRGSNPLWEGSLSAYQLNDDGILPVDAQGNPLDSSRIWTDSIPANRTIKTYRRGQFVDFNSSNLTKEDLGVATDSDRDTLISYVTNLKLGDIFHSNPVIVGEPSQFFEDEGFSGTGGFYQAEKDRTKVVIVGTNDGMLHAFDAATGIEKWAFIPNSLLQNLKTLMSYHTYYVDSSPKAADVWFDDNGDNKKTANEWRTVLVCGLRKGGKSYFALDITDTLNPKYLWEFPNPSDPNYSTILSKLGQSWSEPAIGRVKVGGYEKWVAFIGGGFDSGNSLGKAFYVVDLKTGIPIKGFSGLEGMDASLEAPPTAIDTNADGYIDKVYIGDLKGRMWVFDVSDNNNSNWTGKRLFKAPDGHPIYYQPAVAFDKSGTPWVYFGTGDRENPNDKNSKERFYAVKDDGKGYDGKGTYPLQEKDLSDVTTTNKFDPVSKPGWYIQLAQAEKVLARPVVFNRLVYFTTYTYTESANPCVAGGSGKLYTVEYLSAGGALTVDDLSQLSGPTSERSKVIASGLPSAPAISVTVKGKASVTIEATSGQALSQKAFLATNKQILYWREVIP
jgi:hypothetical protein